MQSFLYALHFIVCFVLITVVLLQRGKGADLGASLGGGGANTLFGSRGAGNFLTKLTSASAIIFMGTSLTLSYLGYQASDVQLFDEDAPFEAPVDGGAPATEEPGGLQEIPVDGDSAGLQEIPVDGDSAGLQEIPVDGDSAGLQEIPAAAAEDAGASAEGPGLVEVEDAAAGSGSANGAEKP
jgi:preprotein translocase subunit SecG